MASAAIPERTDESCPAGNASEDYWLQDATEPVEKIAGQNSSVSRLLLFLIPLTFLVLGVMRHFGIIAIEPLWIYGVMFGVAGVCFGLFEVRVANEPTSVRLNAQMAVSALITTALIYVTGWGPALISVYATSAVLIIVRYGSSTWKTCVMWNLTGIALGQLAVELHIAPSKLPVHDSDAIAAFAAVGFVAMMRIVAYESEQKEAGRHLLGVNEERYRSLVAHSSDLTLLLDASGTEICYASPATTTLLQREPIDLIGKNPDMVVHPDDRKRVMSSISEALSAHDLVRTEFRLVAADGSVREVESVITDLRGNPAVAGFVINLHDITERVELQRNLEYRVHHDALTGLPNRQFMFDRLQEALARFKRSDDGGLVLMYLDLDRFKEVNDQFGHAVGDELLIQFSNRIQAIVRESDLLARFGGDEFVILCEGMSTTDAAMQFAERALRVADAPFHVAGHSCSVGLSIGVARVDQSVSASEALLHADLAMYEAKNRGGAPHLNLFATPQSAR